MMKWRKPKSIHPHHSRNRQRLRRRPQTGPRSRHERPPGQTLRHTQNAGDSRRIIKLMGQWGRIILSHIGDYLTEWDSGDVSYCPTLEIA